MRDRAELWRHAEFLRLWSAQAVSAFGSRITRVALPIIAVQTLREPEAIIALLAALQIAPGVVLAVFAGGFVDRSRKRRILVAADVVRAVLVGSLTLAWALGVLAIWQLIVVGAAVGAASAVFQIADVAFLPTLLAKSQLAEGNAKLESTEAIAEITGPASAGVLIAALGAPLAVVIDAATYVWSAIMLGRIQTTETAIAHVPPEPGSGDLRTGMAALFRHPQLRPVVIAHMVWSITGGFFSALYTLYCLRDLQLSEAVFGSVIALGGIGALFGAILSRALVRRMGLGPALITTAAGSLACGLFIPLAAYATQSQLEVIALLGAHQLLGDGFAVAFIIHAVTLRQTVLPRAVLGRANAAVHVCTMGTLAISTVIAGVIAKLLGVHAAVWIGVVIGLLAPVALWPLRRLRDMPPAASAKVTP